MRYRDNFTTFTFYSRSVARARGIRNAFEKNEPVSPARSTWPAMFTIAASQRYFAGMTEFPPRFCFPLNPNPAISSGRYTGIGNGIVHSNGHRFPPAATTTTAAGRSRGEGQCRGMILPIFGLILVRMCSAVCQGVRPSSLSLSHPL